MKLVDYLRLKELKFNWKAVIATIVTTLVLTVDHYHAIFKTSRDLEEILLYLVIPLLTILVVFRDPPSKFGFQFGDWKAGLALTGIGLVIITSFVPFVARTGSFQDYYETKRSLTAIISSNALELFGWEFFFRGFLLFALLRVAGPTAIFLQAVPFALAHLGKPELETLSTIFGGALFGYIAWRTKSFFYPFLIHWYLATLTIFFAN